MADLSLATGVSAPAPAYIDLKRRTAIAAVEITAGQAFYFNSSGKAALVDANALATAKFDGISVRHVAAGQEFTYYDAGELAGFDLSGLAYRQKVYLSATAGALADADPGVNEVQTVSLTGTPTGGTFTLTYDSVESGNIAYNATTAVLQAALEAISTINPGEINVTGSAGAWLVEFVGDLGKQNIAAMTADGTNLTGGTTPAAAVAETTAGVGSVAVGRVVPKADVPTYTKLLELTGAAG